MWCIINYKDQDANKKIKIQISLLKILNLKFWSSFLESKKLYIWSYRVFFGDALKRFLICEYPTNKKNCKKNKRQISQKILKNLFV